MIEKAKTKTITKAIIKTITTIISFETVFDFL